MTGPGTATVRRTALELVQGRHRVYLFSLAGGDLLRVAGVSRVRRDDSGELIGYQRPAVQRHVGAIRDYLDSREVPLVPDAVVLALGSRARFHPRTVGDADDATRVGILELPVASENAPPDAWIVDGQQRALAHARCARPELPRPVAAFVSTSIKVEREQFVRQNTAQPLPRGLLTELLPHVTAVPAQLSVKALPAAVCAQLAMDPRSPFHGIIRRASDTDNVRNGAVVRDSSLICSIALSLTSPAGYLYAYRDTTAGTVDGEGVHAILAAYWSAVKRTFPEAWGLPPDRSRLMHGVGIRALGGLMDHVMAQLGGATTDIDLIAAELARIAPFCAWTSGRWGDDDGPAWNALENIPKHIAWLTDYLTRSYLRVNGTAGGEEAYHSTVVSVPGVGQPTRRMAGQPDRRHPSTRRIGGGIST